MIGLVLAWTFLPAPLAAEDVGTAAIESARAGLAGSGIATEQRGQGEAELAAADEHLAGLARVQAQLAQLQEELAGLPAQAERLRRSLAGDSDAALQAWLARLPARADVATLEVLLEGERSTIAGLYADIERVSADLASTVSTPMQTLQSQADLRQRIDELATPLAAPEDQAEPLAQARRVRRSAELQLRRAELELRSLEQTAAGQRQEVLDLRLRELRQRLAGHQPRLSLLQERIAAAGRAELEALLARLEAAEQATPADADQVTSHLAADNRELGQRLLADHEQLDRERSQRNDALAESERLAETLRNTRARLELGGRSEQVGRWLWLERSRLPARARLQEQLDQVQTTLAQLRVDRVWINEEQTGLGNIPAAVTRLREDSGLGDEEPAPTKDHRVDATDGVPVMAADDTEPAGGDAAGTAAADTPALPASDSRSITAGWASLLRQKADLLQRLDELQRRRISALEQLQAQRVTQLADSQALAAVLDRHLLWTPSHGPVNVGWLATVPAGLYDLVKPSRMQDTLRLSGRAIAATPLPWLASALLVGLLLAFRGRAAAAIQALAQPVRQVRNDRYRHTLTVMALTAVAALPWALLAWLSGQLLMTVGLAGRYSHSLGASLALLAAAVYGLDLLRWLLRDRGLADAHFRWTPARRQALSTALRRLAPVLLVTCFIIILALERNQLLAVDVQARLAAVVLTGTAAWVLWHLLAPAAVWSSRLGDVDPGPLRRGIRFAVPALMIAVGLLALLGYLYTSLVLLQALVWSAALALAVALVHGLLARWFLLGERRLALCRLEQRRQAAAGEDASVVAEAEEDLALETVNAHTRRLLRALRLSLLAVGLVWVWAEVLPAAARLDDVTLWHFQQAGADGSRVDIPVSLLAVLSGVVVLVLTTIAARNLPGLVELGLARSRIDAATRYAVTSLFRYGIVLAGVLLGLSLLGLRWSQLQWLVAGLTVGLGFGLQEIFANFISGLILLFERPFKVGDTITIGNKTGVVTRIRTRATTLRDGDGKETFIPNKSFITGELTSWSPGETTTSFGIEFSVPYGSDIDKVHELALQAARENVRVLSEPKPASLFKRFGDSTLGFELRVTLGPQANRSLAQNEIATRLLELFAGHGIAMAFPQLDVHLRSLPEGGSGQAPA
ncbi:MAG: mechanosensitive ion channel [Xanthomonadales bacterium]|nr:mechanosensitive ion channel [Xanthomonadales bacterium]